VIKPNDSCTEIDKVEDDSTSSSPRFLSSAGCSRNFIIAVLRKVRDYANNIGFRTIKDIANDVIMQWLEEAKQECENDSTEYGGTTFDPDDKATFWCDSKQFQYWWKNNIERSAKRKSYMDQSTYDKFDTSKIAKARFCKQVISLSNEITQQKNKTKLKTKRTNTTSKVKVKSLNHTKNTTTKVGVPDINAKGAPSDEFTNLLNIAMAYDEANTTKSANNTESNEDDKVYNNKRKAIVVDKTITKRKSIITEEQEDFLSSLSSLTSLSSLSSPAPTPTLTSFSTPSSLSNFVW
jgi:membrane-associated HD superfamily phosphohydrolase